MDEPLPPGITKSQTGWLIRARDYLYRDLWKPCWYFEEGKYCPPIAVVQHSTNEYWLHAQEYMPHGESVRIAGPYDDLLTALVVLRIVRASNSKPNALWDVVALDPTVIPENVR